MMAEGSKHAAAPTREELAAELRNAPAAPGGDEAAAAGGGGGGKPGRKKGEIFDDCPVLPLGVRGKFAYYLDALGQLRAIDNHNAQNILSLFGHFIPRLCYQFPQWEPKGDSVQRKKNRFDQTTAAMHMYQAASECGVFNPDNAVRGVGAWTDDDGKLIYHMGDQILYDGKKLPPGRIGKQIYPAASPIPHPVETANIADPVQPILDTFERWTWAEPDLHPFVALGMVAVQMLCGALDWRPVFWITAAAGSGKSEFQRLLKLLHGDDGLIQTTDATKSGLTSQLGHSCLPVAVDELEPGNERSNKESDIIALARVAASGGQWFRGSADQTGVGGKVYSAFLFSSILIPGAMKTQDVQRLIRLDMNPLDQGAPKLDLQPRTWRARGARLKALLIARWPGWQERLAAWRHALELADVTGRDADNWGAVLAMADMASSDDIAAPDVMANWARKAAFQVAANRADTTNDAEAMLLHLMSQQFDPFRRGQQFTIAQWVMAAAGLPGAPRALVESLSTSEGFGDTDKARRDHANVMLAGLGLRVRLDGDDMQLFLANAPLQPLKDLFRFSDWAGGAWKQSAARVPGATATPQPLTLAGIRSRGHLMPLKNIPGLMSFPMDQGKSDAPASGDELEDFR